MTEAKLKQVIAGQIEIDGGTQARVRLDEATVAEYAEAIQDGSQFPPLDVVFDGSTYWLADGFHRLMAYQRAGIGMIACNVRRGTKSDAIWLSASANTTHGLRRSNADKRKAVALALDLRPNESDRAIAEHCGVNNKTVAAVRKELTEEILSGPAERVGRDGRTINTENIGKRADRPAEDRVVTIQPVRPEPAVDHATDFYEGDSDDDDGRPSLADARAPFDTLIRELGVAKSHIRRIAETTPAGPLIEAFRFDEFDRRVDNAQAVIKACRPHAVCGYCGGDGCDKCKGTGFLAFAAAESAPQPTTAV